MNGDNDVLDELGGVSSLRNVIYLITKWKEMFYLPKVG